MSDEELLQLVRDFTKESMAESRHKEMFIYDRELKARFGPWNRMLERAGTRPIGEHYQGEKRKGGAKNAPVTKGVPQAAPRAAGKALLPSKYFAKLPCRQTRKEGHLTERQD